MHDLQMDKTAVTSQLYVQNHITLVLYFHTFSIHTKSDTLK